MNTCVQSNVCLVGIALGAIVTSAVQGQTVELKSAHLSVLEGAERDRFLAAHNAARKAVEVDPVRWSDEVSKVALDSLEQQKEQLIEAAKEGWDEKQVPLPAHRADTKHGENVAGWVGSGQQPTELAVTYWLREKAAFDKLNKDSDYRVGDEEGQTEVDDNGQERPVIVGHYTAIVWRATRHIGAARLEFTLADERGDARRYVAIICNYSPPGNRHGDKPY
jgi:Cysteine-rich secretory protein family